MRADHHLDDDPGDHRAKVGPLMSGASRFKATKDALKDGVFSANAIEMR